MGSKEPLVLTEFIEGETTFSSTGFSILKITKDGKEQHYKIPIKTVGLVEFQEELRKDAPRPPTKEVKVKKGSVYETDFGLEVGSLAKVFDVTNETYLEEFADYKADFMWRTVLHAIDLKFVDKDTKEEITDYQKKIDILKKSGITGNHLDQLFLDVNRLTSDREKVVDFLSGNTLG